MFLCSFFSVNPEAAQSIIANPNDFVNIVNGLDWTESPMLARQLQDSVQNSTVFGVCGNENVRKDIVDVNFF